MKRVLFLSHYGGIGGANLSLVYLISNMQKQGFVSAKVYIPRKGPIVDLFDKNGILWETHPYLSFRVNSKHSFALFIRRILLLFNWLQAFLLYFKVHKSFDIIYSNTTKVSFGYNLKVITGLPLVWHLREFGNEDYNLNFVFSKKRINKYFEQASCLIAISKEIMNYYKTKVCPYGKYSLVYNGIEISNYLFSKCSNATPRICVVGGVSESKNQGELINALKILSQRKVRFVADIIGDDSSEYAKILKHDCINNKLNNICFLGQKNEINKLLFAYDIGVLTSKYEAFGRVIVEYMLAGLAVVASDSGACPEIIDDGATGFLYGLGNAVDLADKLQLLIEDKELRFSVANNGKEKALNTFSAENNARIVGSLISSL